MTPPSKRQERREETPPCTVAPLFDRSPGVALEEEDEVRELGGGEEVVEERVPLVPDVGERNLRGKEPGGGDR